MRGGLGILTHNNFAGQVRDGPMRGGLARFATPNF